MKDVIRLATHTACTQCSACAQICPTNSITMLPDSAGFPQPSIDNNTCIECHKCEKTCPVLHPNVVLNEPLKVVFARHKDENIRLRSSSGGMFYAMAKWTIGHGGVVFGARFDENWEVVHDYTQTLEGIASFMGSKYVQSRVGETFRQVKQFLKDGRRVLYTGTPCQIAGLKAYLKNDDDNLITCDLICHGVASPGIWKKYLKEEFDDLSNIRGIFLETKQMVGIKVFAQDMSFCEIIK